MLHMQVNGFVSQFVEKIPFPVPVQARRVEGVKGTLQGWVRHGLNAVHRGRAKFLDGLEHRLGFFLRTCVTPDDATHLLHV